MRLKSQKLVLVLFSLFVSYLAEAQGIYYWDIDGLTEGAGGLFPAGIWDFVTPNWSTNLDGIADTTTWLDGNIAVFSAGTNATGAYSVSVGGLISPNSIQFEEGNLSLDGGEIDLNGTNGISVAAGLSVTMNSVLGGSVGLSKSGAGSLLLGGGNFYSGATIINEGNLILNGPDRIPEGSVVSIASGAIFDLNNFNQTIGSLSGAGNLLLGAGVLTVGGDGTSTVFSGAMTGSGQLIKTGGGVMTLSGNNTYTGLTTITGGSLRLGAANRIADTSAVSVGSGTIFNLNNFAETVGSLDGAGTVSLGSGTLAAGGNNTSTTFSGNITGSGGFTKKGNGKMTLTGTGSSYTGPTRIEAGTLSINGTTPLGSSASLLDLAGGILDISISRSITNQVSLTASSQLSASVASGTRTLTFLSGTFNNTAGTLTIRNTGTGGGISVRLRSGGLNISRPIVIGQVGDANNAATNAILRCDHQSGADQIISGNISGPGIFERNSSASLGGFRTILTGNNSYSGRTDLRGGFIGVGSATALGRAPINIGQDPQLLGFFASGAARTVTNSLTFEATTAAATNLILSGALPLTFTGPVTLHPTTTCRLLVSNGMIATFSGVISGNTGLEKTEANTLILAGANLYSGVTVVSGGTLLVNNQTGSGTGTSTVAVNSGATLGGAGRVTGAVTLSNGGRISPGTNTANAATLALFGGLNLSAGGTNIWELTANSANSPGVNFDQITLTAGALALGGSSKLIISFGGTATVPNLSNPFWQAAHSWSLISLGGTATNPGASRFTTVSCPQYPSLQYFSQSVDARGNVILTYDPTSPFFGLFDIGPGFFSGENFSFTNTTGQALSVWSSANGGRSITNWSFEGALGDQPLNDGSGNSRYSINLTPSASPMYYISGRQTTGPYPATVPVLRITTDEFGAYTILNTNVGINAAGVLDLPAPPDIVQQPSPKTVLTGKNGAFNIIANSFSAPAYQWIFSPGTLLTQGTSAILALNEVTGLQAGNYRVVVTNAYGSATSSIAALTVLPLPQLLVAPTANGLQFSGNVVPGDSYILQMATNLAAPVTWLPLATNIAAPSGIVTFGETNLTANPSRFFRLQAP